MTSIQRMNANEGPLTVIYKYIYITRHEGDIWYLLSSDGAHAPVSTLLCDSCIADQV